MKQIFNALTIVIALILFTKCGNKTTNSIDLSGEWTVRLDADEIGETEKWYSQLHTKPIHLPGCLSEGGYGEEPGPGTKWWAPLDLSLRHPSLAKYAKADSNFKLVQFLMPEHYYIGAAWYNKEIEIPQSFDGKQLQLSLERCHWESTVWVDGQKLGSDQSLAAPHKYDLSQFKPGKHLLSIRIDNGRIVELGDMPHSVSDQTQGAWNGIVGQISLRASDKVSIENTMVYPNIYTKSVKVKVLLNNPDKLNGTVNLTADAQGYNNGNNHNPAAIANSFDLSGNESQTIELEYALGEDAKLWDEFDPNLYNLKVAINGDGFVDKFETSFGIRKISYTGSYFYVNDTLSYLRGNVDCAVNPATGYAPMTVERWKEIFQVYKDHGLNHARFHSWCPPKQAFIAADELGIYLAPEVHDWSYISTKEQMEFLDKESITILDYMGNHASFVTLAIGNEMGMDTTYAHNMVNKWKAHDARHLYTFKISAHHYEDNPSNIDFESLARIPDKTQPLGIMHIKQLATWPPSPKVSIFTITKPQTTLDWSDISQFYKRNYNKPLIAHEIAQFCAYPNIPVEKAKYTSYLRPTYLEIAEEQLKERGMYDQIEEFVHASGEWQVAVTKEEFEAVLRTPDLGGFQWLCLSDFTGQNIAPVGFADAFYDSKPYVTSEETKRFCNSSVLLARLPARIFTNDEKFSATMELCHYHKKRISLDDFSAQIVDEKGNVLETKTIKAGTYNQGNVQVIGDIEFDLSTITTPAKYKLKIASVSNKLENDYDFWVYSREKKQDFPLDIIVSEKWNTKTKEALENGETVLLLPQIGSLKARMPICFTTFFWTAFGEKGGQSSACGITLDNQHLLFKHFPTENHANWHWWEMLTQCQPMVLDQFEEEHPWPKDYRALIQPIDSWKLNRKLGLVVEAKVGKGKILICSIDIMNDLDNRHVARQFRKSVINYIRSADFNPETKVTMDIISALFDQSKPEFLTNMQGLPMQ